MKTDISALLPPEKIWLPKAAPQKRQLIETLTRLACAGLEEADCAFAAEQVLKREATLPAVLDTGLAVPHARLGEVQDFVAALAVFPEPEAKKGARAVFLFLSPDKPEFFSRHLQLLAAAAETFTPAFMQELAAQRSERAVSALLAERSKSCAGVI